MADILLDLGYAVDAACTARRCSRALFAVRPGFVPSCAMARSDAIDTLRFESLTKPELQDAGSAEFKIKLIPDEEQGTLTVRDNGIGMSKESMIENLGTIARSGTKAFLESLKQADVKDRPELIGQFGVGFYSAFMIADKVTVLSRPAGAPASAGVRWESDGLGAFSVDTVEKPDPGTDVILHVRAEDKEFLQPWKLRAIVKKYSDFVAHPIVMDVEQEDDAKNLTKVEETLNSRKAIWLRPRSEITKEEYDEFYKHIAHDTAAPAKTIHYAAEGAIEFKALLYIPAHRPLDLLWGDSHKGLQLYIQRVFIMDDCEALLPLYLRFVKGVVDSPDLPLNVSREMLQQSAPLEKIKSNLVNKALSTLDEMKNKEYDAYVSFYKELGVFLKEGVHQDWSNRQKLADLLLFESTKTEPGKFTTLAQYVLAMPSEQNEIYYLIGETREQLEHSPYLESFRDKGSAPAHRPGRRVCHRRAYGVQGEEAQGRRPRRAGRYAPLRRDETGVSAAAGLPEGQTRGCQGSASVEPSQGERRLPGCRRVRHGCPHGAANATARQGQGLAGVAAHPGAESEPSGRAGLA
jgi:molecular chaperone HtpG